MRPNFITGKPKRFYIRKSISFKPYIFREKSQGVLFINLWPFYLIIDLNLDWRRKIWDKFFNSKCKVCGEPLRVNNAGQVVHYHSKECRRNRHKRTGHRLAPAL